MRYLGHVRMQPVTRHHCTLLLLCRMLGQQGHDKMGRGGRRFTHCTAASPMLGMLVQPWWPALWSLVVLVVSACWQHQRVLGHALVTAGIRLHRPPPSDACTSLRCHPPTDACTSLRCHLPTDACAPLRCDLPTDTCAPLRAPVTRLQVPSALGGRCSVRCTRRVCHLLERVWRGDAD